VKRSNCHRSYYRCSEETCPAKKTVEQELIPKEGCPTKVWCTTASQHNHPRVCKWVDTVPNPGAIIVSVQEKHKYRLEDGYSDAQSHRGPLTDSPAVISHVIEEDSDNVSADSYDQMDDQRSRVLSQLSQSILVAQ